MATLLTSSAFRISAAFALVVTILTSGVFAFVYWDVSAASIAQVRTVLVDEARMSKQISLEDLKGQLSLRLTHDLRRVDYASVFNRDGTLLFGNLSAIPVAADDAAHLTDFPLTGTQDPQPAIFVAVPLAAGGTLVLGRSLLYVIHLEEAMRRAFLTAIVPVVLIALVSGIVVGDRASRRLLAIQRAIRRVMLGELSVRLPERASKSDIDALVRAVNSMLDEIVRLVNQIKSVGDNIAHDLRAPLALMRAKLERGCRADSPGLLQQAAGDALVSLDNALAIVNALLRISELESGARRAAFRDAELAAICHDIFDMFEPVGTEKGIVMSLDSPESLVIPGDEDLLREALANLIGNAVKFTPAGGRITVQCGREGALIRVIDTGPGIAPEDRDKIFQRFYRSSAATGTPGFGLGLNMAATIAELHGGTLQAAANRPGAVFEWIMPAADR